VQVHIPGMARKHRADLPLAEEWLDRGVALLEGPLNRALERVMRSRVVLWPVGAGLAVTLKALALVVPKPPWTPSKAPSTSKAKAPSQATSPAGEAAR
jgi:hypothetical protein